VSRRHIPLTVKAEALALVASGLSLRKAAATVGVDHATVIRWAAAAGIVLSRARAAKGACAHARLLVPARICANCGKAIAPPSPPAATAPPKWAQSMPGPDKPPLRIPSPSW
jgi:hypothetical protein